MFDKHLHGRKGSAYYRNTTAGALNALTAIAIPTVTYFASSGNLVATVIAGAFGALIASIGLFASRSHYMSGGKDTGIMEGYQWSKRSGAICRTLAIGIPVIGTAAWGINKFLM